MTRPPHARAALISRADDSAAPRTTPARRLAGLLRGDAGVQRDRREVHARGHQPGDQGGGERDARPTPSRRFRAGSRRPSGRPRAGSAGRGSRRRSGGRSSRPVGPGRRAPTRARAGCRYPSGTRPRPSATARRSTRRTSPTAPPHPPRHRAGPEPRRARCAARRRGRRRRGRARRGPRPARPSSSPSTSALTVADVLTTSTSPARRCSGRSRNWPWDRPSGVATSRRTSSRSSPRSSAGCGAKAEAVK